MPQIDHTDTKKLSLSPKIRAHEISSTLDVPLPPAGSATRVQPFSTLVQQQHPGSIKAPDVYRQHRGFATSNFIQTAQKGGGTP